MATLAPMLNVEQFTFAIAGLGEPLRVASFQGQEGLSQPFHYTLTLAALDGELGFADVIGQYGVLTIFGSEGDPSRDVHGVVSAFVQGETALDERTGTRFTTYHAELVPHIKLLAFRHDCRIFQTLDVPTIIKQVFTKANIPADAYRFDLSASYAPRDYCVQYRESDLNFVSRLMEDEGLFYYFEHSANRHVIVIADSATAYAEMAGPSAIEYHEGAGLLADDEFVFDLTYAQGVVSNTLTLRDFDFKRPVLDHMELTRADNDGQTLEIYDYPGQYVDPDGVGKHRIDTRFEALQASRRTLRGSTTTRRMFAGARFSLTGHPRRNFNDNYVATTFTHSGSQSAAFEEESGGGGSYQASFSAVPATVVFRAPRTARRPVVEGVQTAIVVGPEGEEIYTDDFGRVKVQFHWDRLGTYNEDSSCWIRVSHAWAGAGWGAIYTPRIQQEVIVDFLEGDPDRPIITGRVYHGTNRPPYPLPQDKTKSTLKSDSSKGGGGSNELRFEDKKGEEEVYIHAQKDMNEQIENNMSTTVGVDQSLTVGNDRTKTIKNDETSTIVHDRTKTVQNDENATIVNNRTATIDNGNDTVTVKTGNRIIDINTGNHHLTVKTGDRIVDVNAGHDTHTVKTGDRTVNINAGADTLNIKTGDRTTNVNAGADTLNVKTGARTVNAKAGHTTNANGPVAINAIENGVSITAAEQIVLTTGASSLTMTKDGAITLVGDIITVVGDTSTAVSAPDVAVTGTTSAILGVGMQSVACGNEKVEVSGAGIASTAVGEHILTGAIIKIN